MERTARPETKARLDSRAKQEPLVPKENPEIPVRPEAQESLEKMVRPEQPEQQAAAGIMAPMETLVEQQRTCRT